MLLVFPDNYWIALRITDFNLTSRPRECDLKIPSKNSMRRATPLLNMTIPTKHEILGT